MCQLLIYHTIIGLERKDYYHHQLSCQIVALVVVAIMFTYNLSKMASRCKAQNDDRMKQQIPRDDQLRRYGPFNVDRTQDVRQQGRCY